MDREYRRRKDDEAATSESKWHFCPQCTHWPTADYVSRRTAPGSGELCFECRSRHAAIFNCNQRWRAGRLFSWLTGRRRPNSR